MGVFCDHSEGPRYKHQNRHAYATDSKDDDDSLLLPAKHKYRLYGSGKTEKYGRYVKRYMDELQHDIIGRIAGDGNVQPQLVW